MKNEFLIPQLWSIREAAEHTHVSSYYIRQLVKNGKVKSIKTGKKYLINAFSLCNFLNGEEEKNNAG